MRERKPSKIKSVVPPSKGLFYAIPENVFEVRVYNNFDSEIVITISEREERLEISVESFREEL